MKELSYLNKYFWKYKWRFILGLLFVVVANYFAIKPAEYVRKSFDLVRLSVLEIKAKQGTDVVPDLVEKFGDQVLFYGLLIVAMALLRGVFLFFMRQSIIVMSRLIEFDLKSKPKSGISDKNGTPELDLDLVRLTSPAITAV